jgi:hypothetical protein
LQHELGEERQKNQEPDAARCGKQRAAKTRHQPFFPPRGKKRAQSEHEKCRFRVSKGEEKTDGIKRQKGGRALRDRAVFIFATQQSVEKEEGSQKTEV